MREMAVSLNDQSKENEENNKLKEVFVRFVGSDEVVQHILPLKEKKFVSRSKSETAKKNRRVSYAKYLEDDDDDEIDDDEKDVLGENSDEILEDCKSSSALPVHAEGVVGSDLFNFRTPRKSKQMVAKASESLTPRMSALKLSQKTPDRKQPLNAAASTPASAKRTPRSTVKKTPLARVKATEVETPQAGTKRSRRLAASTPHRLWQRNDENQSESSDSCVSTDEEEPNKATDVEESVCVTPSSSSKTPVTKGAGTSAKSKTATPQSSRKPVASKKKKLFAEDLTENVESYFDAQTAPVHTSDRTLSRLETPSMSTTEMIDALKKYEFAYDRERNSLVSGYRELFNKWMFLMCHDYNILLYGFGSKYCIIEEFRKLMLKDFAHVVINGYFPSLSIKSILNSITEDIIEHSGSFSNVVEQCEFIRTHFENGEAQDFFLVVHNIDGAMLRPEKSQSILSILAKIRGFHLIASVDHINASLLWDQTKITNFRWLWYDATTFENYTNETSYENSLLVQQTGNLAMSSLVHVMRSLTANARGIFLLLARYQLDNQENNAYQGLPFPDFYQKCREAFLVNSELTLRTQLTEFKDHKLIRTKKGIDGAEYLMISLDSATLTQYLEDSEEQR